MEPTYVRGMAYLQLHHDSLAAGEFQKMIDHRGPVRNFVTGALAHLQLTPADARSGNMEAAWTESEFPGSVERLADPDSPIQGQAKAEYAKLA